MTFLCVFASTIRTYTTLKCMREIRVTPVVAHCASAVFPHVIAWRRGGRIGITDIHSADSAQIWEHSLTLMLAFLAAIRAHALVVCMGTGDVVGYGTVAIKEPDASYLSVYTEVAVLHVVHGMTDRNCKVIQISACGYDVTFLPYYGTLYFLCKDDVDES